MGQLDHWPKGICMLYGHVFFGLVVGLLSASLALVMGVSPWAAVAYLVLGSNVGLLLSVVELRTRALSGAQ